MAKRGRYKSKDNIPKCNTILSRGRYCPRSRLELPFSEPIRYTRHCDQHGGLEERENYLAAKAQQAKNQANDTTNTDKNPKAGGSVGYNDLPLLSDTSGSSSSSTLGAPLYIQDLQKNLQAISKLIERLEKETETNRDIETLMKVYDRQGKMIDQIQRVEAESIKSMKEQHIEKVRKIFRTMAKYVEDKKVLQKIVDELKEEENGEV